MQKQSSSNILSQAAAVGTCADRPRHCLVWAGFLTSKEMESFPTAWQGPLGRTGLLKALFYFQIFLGEEGLCGIVQF